jgi:histone-lysine N-methyltransferase SETMAR
VHVRHKLLHLFCWELLDHLPCSPDLALSDFHLFGPLKQHLSGYQFHNNKGVELAICEWLQMQELDFYCDGTFELV